MKKSDKVVCENSFIRYKVKLLKHKAYESSGHC